ncbi:SH3 domain-containing protein [Oceanobacillus sp. HCA-5259]|uniref:SH3 domain-containing protein n=1 Tax=Oceanobacillus sp. HCA-5259 TaxID=3134661 RepID=UPI0030C51DC1
MKRTKAFIAIILTIVALAFVVFVGIMQQKFTNPDLASMSYPQADTESVTTDEKNESDEEEAEGTDSVAGAVGSVINDEEADDTEDAEEIEATTSTRTVEVETLNARSGPGVDYDLVGVLVMDQQVEVEDRGEEWVKVTTDEFTGYVNVKFLSEE